MTNGCFNRPPFKQERLVQDGWHEVRSPRGYMTREPVMVTIPFRMSPDCEYSLTDLGKADSGCDGCKHRRGAA